MIHAATLAGLRIGGDAPVRLMAVLNVSPESFYPGSVRADAAALRDAAQRAVAEGADLLDIGARSTAPYGETALPVAEEVRRMRWALGVVAPAVSAPLSADTTRAAVAAAALASGARLINDVSGLRGDPAMADIALHEIVLDPGIGFFATAGTPATAFNVAVLRQLDALADLERPLLVGVSRKRFLGALSGRDDPADRLAGSLAATAVAVLRGAAVVRTHDVAATRDAVRVAAALRA